MEEEKTIPKGIATTVINALSSGVTPRRGLEYITVGRKKEVQTLLSDLEAVADGGSTFKIIVGKYGSGKSFMLQAIRNYAMENNFVVMDADLTPERRLAGSKKQGLATYRELIKNTAIKSKQMGGALESILQKWLNKLQREVNHGVDGDSPMLSDYLSSEMENKIDEEIYNMEMMVHDYEFAKVIKYYWIGYHADDNRKQIALKWLRGEYDSKTEAKKDLGINTIISDADWFDYIKLWAEFVTTIGYKGLVVFIDEVKVLANISSKVAREANYEKFLTIFNDTMQGHSQHLSIIMSGTNEFVEDTRRGLYSYDAIRSRLETGRFNNIKGKRNWDAPLMELSLLSNEEIFLLMSKIQEIHAIRYDYEPRLSDDQLTEILEATINRVGTSTNLTAREVTRNMMDILGVLHHNPEISFSDILSNNIHDPEYEKDDEDIDDDLV